MAGRSTTDRLFSATDRERVAAAVAAVEERTRGEVVIAVADSSDPYPGAAWATATAGALAAALAAAALHLWGGFWGGSPIVWTALPPAAGAALGYLAALVPAVRRRLVPGGLLDRRVELAAAAAFVDHEVFATRDRSGVLLFLSLFEHRVVVVGDAGVDAHVAAGEWDEVVARVTAGIRRGDPAAGLIDALERVGEILDRAGLERRPDDVNELPDAPRLGGG